MILRGTTAICPRCWAQEPLPAPLGDVPWEWAREWEERHAACEVRPCCRLCLATEGLVQVGTTETLWLCGACWTPETRVETANGVVVVDRRRRW